MSVTGGSIVPMRLFGSDVSMLDISADASKALALKPDLDDEIGRGTLWTVSMLGGAPRKLSAHLRVGLQMVALLHFRTSGRST
jgi:hypothetical protein